MNVPSVTSASANTAITDAFTNPSSALNQTDFLKLLVAQIQFQDPMNPQSDTQMAAQLAQFTSLQQATQSSASLAMIQANSLVGNTVTVQVDAQNTASGVVTGVAMVNGAPQITVNGTNYQLSQVTAVKPVPTTTATNASPAGAATNSAAANPVSTLASTVAQVTSGATSAATTVAAAAARAVAASTSRTQSTK